MRSTMSSRTEQWKRELRVGAVVRRSPGVTRWVKEIWKPVAVIPGAPDAFWKELVREEDVVDYHASTVTMELFRADVEGYLVSLNMAVPSVWIIMDRDVTSQSPSGWVVSTITASAHEALDALDSGESIVEAVPIPESMAAWIKEFIDMHYIEEPFKKRRRDEVRVDGAEDAKGDPRIRQESDVYRAPANIKKPRIQ
ncbi:molybdopterin-guanine dinucleotide biosynthesis protein A [Marinobacter adhaerens HP15]|uniref:Molybdopterin-guanine dinucleotide biosynthesis protein A n=2 Tax=Marinobacter adhaerens TaxID=1033846 RepID=E4PMH9_MARAH|nr:molybdopterin-guanine dinucleotide biosynthesis protein A [Marinobacter adhaerens HP15]